VIWPRPRGPWRPGWLKNPAVRAVILILGHLRGKAQRGPVRPVHERDEIRHVVLDAISGRHGLSLWRPCHKADESWHHARLLASAAETNHGTMPGCSRRRRVCQYRSAPLPPSPPTASSGRRQALSEYPICDVLSRGRQARFSNGCEVGMPGSGLEAPAGIPTSHPWAKAITAREAGRHRALRRATDEPR
jgi:hypothetical protein